MANPTTVPEHIIVPDPFVSIILLFSYGNIRYSRCRRRRDALLLTTYRFRKHRLCKFHRPWTCPHPPEQFPSIDVEFHLLRCSLLPMLVSLRREPATGRDRLADVRLDRRDDFSDPGSVLRSEER